MTPPCEQPLLYSFGGFGVSSERQPLPVDGFPRHPRAEYRRFCLRLLCHLPVQGDTGEPSPVGSGGPPGWEGHLPQSPSGLRVQWLFFRSDIPVFFRVLFTFYQPVSYNTHILQLKSEQESEHNKNINSETYLYLLFSYRRSFLLQSVSWKSVSFSRLMSHKHLHLNVF